MSWKSHVQCWSCGAVDEDHQVPWHYDLSTSDDSVVIECWKCGVVMEVVVLVTTEYATIPTNKEPEDGPLLDLLKGEDNE